MVDATGPVSRTRHASGLRLHPASDPAPTVDVDGCPAVDVATALAQVGLRSGRLPVVVALDAALHRGLTTTDDVLARVRQLCDGERPLHRTARWVASADGASESVGETRTRLLLHDLGFRVRSQVRIADHDGGVVARVDLLVEDRVVVEFDGLVKYAGADGRAALVAEKRREDRLRALGFVVVRLTWRDLEHPERVARLVRAAVARVAA